MRSPEIKRKTNKNQAEKGDINRNVIDLLFLKSGGEGQGEGHLVQITSIYRFLCKVS